MPDHYINRLKAEAQERGEDDMDDDDDESSEDSDFNPGEEGSDLELKWDISWFKFPIYLFIYFFLLS